MDGENETGAHPHQAAALKAYLNGHFNAHEAALAMTKSRAFEFVSEKKTDLRDRILGIIQDALVELPERHTRPLIALLMELAQLPDKVDGYPVWKNLSKTFGDSKSDAWKEAHWRQALETQTRDPAARQRIREKLVHLAFVEASCAVAGVLPLDWGYECISDALECHGAVRDFEVPVAAVWMEIAGRRLMQGATEAERSWALEREGRLWAAGPMSLDRWNFWIERLDELKKIDGVCISDLSIMRSV
ncbi:hypothetical protein BDW74DRAFT_176601 [Aspergillus multicolor]|uniref:DUF3632 domain-containing protein n=1 Tax=Aspergillus multicolor TaxID=41759 RepID=UPI003CCE1018